MSQEAQHSLVWSEEEQNFGFYTDNSQIAGRDHIGVQNALMVTVAMFRKVGLKTNLENTKAMAYTPVFI